MDIKRLLNKKGWTGRELGILELTNMAVLFRQAIEGQEPKPLVGQAQLRKMINTITDRQQGLVYNGYISIHEWLSIRYNIAQTQLQQAQLQYRTLVGYITDATLAEDVYRYIEQLPAIMTQKQYEDTKARSIEERFKDEDGEELYSNVFNLVERAISFYLKQLQREPNKPNPLKAIRKKYVSQPVKSEYIRSRWNEITGEGYYTIEDGSGRRSDQMTSEEWHAALAPPPMEPHQKTQQRIERTVARARVIYNGGTEKDADKAQEENDRQRGLTVPCQWHYYEDPPEELTKWDIIEQELLLELYPADLDGSGDAYSESNYTASMEDFVAEFRELVTTILKDIAKKHPTEGASLPQLPVKEWLTTGWSWRDLYKLDFYGEREQAEADISVFDGNKRALFNGVAILRASDLIDRSPRIDERGYYVEPDISPTLSNFTLEAFFTEAEDYADNIEIVETARQTLIESYYHLKGYNLTLELIARFYEVPEMTVFQMDTDGIEDKIRAFNELVPILYKKILDTDYGDKELQAKKLQVLKELFQPIDYEAIAIPAENVEQAEELLKDFAAFKPENADRFNSLLCVLPEGAAESEDGEGAY